MSYEIPSSERQSRLLRKEIDITRHLARFASSPSSQVETSSFGAGAGQNATGTKFGAFVLAPQTHNVCIEFDWIGVGALNLGDEIQTNVNGWKGRLVLQTSGNSVIGTGVFEPTVAIAFLNVPQTLTKVAGGWTAVYAGITLKTNRVVVSSASMIINDLMGDPVVKVIYGASNDGHITTVKPKEGKVLTFQTGGNIDIGADVEVGDGKIALLQFFEENTTPDPNGNWSVTTSAGSSSDIVWTVDHDANGFSLIELLSITFKTTSAEAIGIIAVDSAPANGIIDRLEYYAAESNGAHDFYVNQSVTTYPRFGITATSLESNVDLNMNQASIREVYSLGGAANADHLIFSNSLVSGDPFDGWQYNVPSSHRHKFSVNFSSVFQMTSTLSEFYTPLNVNGNLVVSGNITLGDSTADSLLFKARASGILSPILDQDPFDRIGEAGHRWPQGWITTIIDSETSGSVKKHGFVTAGWKAQIPNTQTYEFYVRNSGNTADVLALYIDETEVNLNASRLSNVNFIQYITSGTFFSSSTYYSAAVSNAKLRHNAPSGKKHVFSINGTDELEIDASAIYPTSNNGLNLGETGTGEFANLYIGTIQARTQIVLLNSSVSPTVNGEFRLDGTNVEIYSGGAARSMSSPTFDNLVVTGASTHGSTSADSLNVFAKTVHFASVRYPTTSQSGTYNVTADDHMIICTSTGNQTMNLPTAIGIAGRVYMFYKTQTTGTVTIDGNGSQTLDGATTQTITTQYGIIRIMSDGANWMLI